MKSLGAILFLAPSKLNSSELRIAIIVGCAFIAPLLFLCLIKGFYQTHIFVDAACLLFHLYGWLRVILCENYRMFKNQGL